MNLKIKYIESVSACQSNCENLLAEYTYFFVRLQIYFTLPRETTLLNLKQKLKSMNNCTVSECFDKFLSIALSSQFV